MLHHTPGAAAVTFPGANCGCGRLFCEFREIALRDRIRSPSAHCIAVLAVVGSAIIVPTTTPQRVFRIGQLRERSYSALFSEELSDGFVTLFQRYIEWSLVHVGGGVDVSTDIGAEQAETAADARTFSASSS